MPVPAPDRSTPTGVGATRRFWVGLDEASTMGTELIAAILTWSGVGWLLDQWLGTRPWLLVSGAMIGNAAGLYLVWLRSGRMEQREISEAKERAERQR